MLGAGRGLLPPAPLAARPGHRRRHPLPPAASATPAASGAPTPVIQAPGRFRVEAQRSRRCEGRSTLFIWLDPGPAGKAWGSSARPWRGSVPPLAGAVLLAARRPVFLAGAPQRGPGLPFPVLRVSGLLHPGPAAPFAGLPAPGAGSRGLPGSPRLLRPPRFLRPPRSLLLSGLLLPRTLFPRPLLGPSVGQGCALLLGGLPRLPFVLPRSRRGHLEPLLCLHLGRRGHRWGCPGHGLRLHERQWGWWGQHRPSLPTWALCPERGPRAHRPVSWKEALTKCGAGFWGDELGGTHGSGTGAGAPASPATASGRGPEGTPVSPQRGADHAVIPGLPTTTPSA